MLVILLVTIVIFSLSKSTDDNTKLATFRSEKLGFELFFDSANLEIEELDDSVHIYNTVLFAHEDPCDFRDITEIENFNDVDIYVRLSDQGLIETLKSEGLEHLIKDNELDSDLIVSEMGGYIGKIGGKKTVGRISAVEGCGWYETYVELTKNKTLVTREQIVTIALIIGSPDKPRFEEALEQYGHQKSNFTYRKPNIIVEDIIKGVQIIRDKKVSHDYDLSGKMR